MGRRSGRFRALVMGLSLVGLTGSGWSRKLRVRRPRPAPVRVIFDTDMGNDVDDADLASRDAPFPGYATRLRPAGGHVDQESSAGRSLCRRGEHVLSASGLPIGVRRKGKLEDSKFLPLATVEDAEKLRFPNDLDADKAPDAVELLRKLLAAEPDGSVTLVQVGFFSNLADLLDTPADSLSPLTGRQLIERKVKLLSVMAGAFPDHRVE